VQTHKPASISVVRAVWDAPLGALCPKAWAASPGRFVGLSGAVVDAVEVGTEDAIWVAVQMGVKAAVKATNG